MANVRQLGLQVVLSRALELIGQDVDGFYVSVCSDVIDHAYNPGGPPDFGGLTPSDMCEALYRLGQEKILGLDLVEVYPRYDVNDASVHLLVWQVIYALAGLATRLQTLS